MISDRVLTKLKRAVEWPDLNATRYRVIEEIGRGGMGVVYRAEDLELKREVAIKVLDDGGEALVLASLEHPGIVPVHETGVLPDGRCWYAMKLVRGTRLDRLAMPHLPDRLRVFQRVCEPVAFAHARGTIHRDLKPSNIMVGEFGEVLVLDWGAPGTGTPAFMAPEQSGTGVVDSWADIFALGRVLEELAQPIPKPVLSICRRATHFDPSLRYQNVTELAADIGAYLDGMRVSAHRESVAERVIRFVSRNHTLMALVAAYLAMRIILIIWLRR